VRCLIYADVPYRYSHWLLPAELLPADRTELRLGIRGLNGSCLNPADVTEFANCPAGFAVRTWEGIEAQCQALGRTCPVNYTCICNPCQALSLEPDYGATAWLGVAHEQHMLAACPAPAGSCTRTAFDTAQSAPFRVAVLLLLVYSLTDVQWPILVQRTCCEPSIGLRCV
jgi:hypothetical protein